MMIIEQIDLYHVKMPLLEPWVTAYGSQNDIESVFVNGIETFSKGQLTGQRSGRYIGREKTALKELQNSN